MSGLAAEFAKRSEVTVQTMGHVHNPSGSGISATSSIAKSAALKAEQKKTEAMAEILDAPTDGSSKRNITRKKNEFSYDNKNKKQGGHGKNKWQDVEGSSGTRVKLDRKDPLYDSEDEDKNYVLVSGSVESDSYMGSSPPRHSYDPERRRQVIGPMLTLSEFKLRLADALREYFLSGDSQECLQRIVECGCNEYHFYVTKSAISLSLDSTPAARELVSKLLSASYPSVLSMEDIGKGFERVFEGLDELNIDVPGAKGGVVSFLSRAVVDELLPPSFLTDPMIKNLGGEVVEKAVLLLEREHSSIRLEKVWGTGDGRPVAELKGAMDLLLKEFLLSRELDEALACVEEMSASFFHHELVKRGVKAAMDEDDSETNIQNMSTLFKFLHDRDAVSAIQFKKGFDRCHQLLGDFKLDCPNAEAYLKLFVDQAKDDGILAKDYVSENP